MKNRSTQSDIGLDFDGAKLLSQNRSNKFRGNQWSGHSNDGREVNFGRGPTKGNQDYDARQGAHREPPTAALKGKPSNTDSMNFGRGPRGGGRAWDPKAGQNYNGNPDMINAGRGPRKGNQQ